MPRDRRRDTNFRCGRAGQPLNSAAPPPPRPRFRPQRRQETRLHGGRMLTVYNAHWICRAGNYVSRAREGRAEKRREMDGEGGRGMRGEVEIQPIAAMKSRSRSRKRKKERKRREREKEGYGRKREWKGRERERGKEGTRWKERCANRARIIFG